MSQRMIGVRQPWLPLCAPARVMIAGMALSTAFTRCTAPDRVGADGRVGRWCAGGGRLSRRRGLRAVGVGPGMGDPRCRSRRSWWTWRHRCRYWRPAPVTSGPRGRAVGKRNYGSVHPPGKVPARAHQARPEGVVAFRSARMRSAGPRTASLTGIHRGRCAKDCPSRGSFQPPRASLDAAFGRPGPARAAGSRSCRRSKGIG
jgi:hypothetical protein